MANVCVYSTFGLVVGMLQDAMVCTEAKIGYMFSTRSGASETMHFLIDAAFHAYSAHVARVALVTSH